MLKRGGYTNVWVDRTYMMCTWCYVLIEYLIINILQAYTAKENCLIVYQSPLGIKCSEVTMFLQAYFKHKKWQNDNLMMLFSIILFGFRLIMHHVNKVLLIYITMWIMLYLSSGK